MQNVIKGRKTIFIFGLSSFMGSNLAEIFKKRYRVVGTYHKTPVDIEDVLAIPCDVNDKDSVRKLIYLYKPDYTFYAIGLSSLKDCQASPKLAEALNTAGVFNVTNATERYNSRFIYFSSSYVFSGENTEFIEHDTPTPSSIYGSTVTSAEFYIQKSCLNYLILRCPSLIGRTYHPLDVSFVEAIERNSIQNKKITSDSVVYTGFVDFYTLADCLDKALRIGISNRVLQICSSDVMSRYEFAKLYMRIFNLNENLVVKGEWGFPRTENKIALQGLGEELFFNLSTKSLEGAIGYDPPTIEEAIMRFKRSVEKGLDLKEHRKNIGISFI